MIYGLLVLVLLATTTITTSTSATTGSSEPTEEVEKVSLGQSDGRAPASSKVEFDRRRSSSSGREEDAKGHSEASSGVAGSGKVYTNQFVIRVEGGEQEARKLAEKHGFVYLNHILGDYYHLEHRRLSKRAASATQETLNISIQEEPQVLMLERQVLKRRVKRDFLELAKPANDYAGVNGRPRTHQAPPQLLLPHTLRPAQPYTRPANQAPPGRPATSRQQLAPVTRPLELEPLEAAASNASALHQSAGPAHARDPPARNGSSLVSDKKWAHGKQMPFNDPSWPLMWYLDGGAKNGFDLNVMAAWKMGYTGKGIVITILDDGLEKDHPDLQANYDPLASFDINGDDADPMPRYDMNDSNRHGTRCAGEVAAVPDNNICSIGIAYNSKVGGVRMLDGDVTDAVEARSLGLNNQHIHIYSASWGPDDNGKTVDGPGEMATKAFIEGVTNGRQGLGSIFVFASGNGGRDHDNCNCDGYTNSIWTLSISSATENGFVPWYIEACSSTLATTYSSGSYEERQIATTDLHHTCTSSHTGTSASAPLAAGICALVLESNPKLTWRDMQHIVVRTAKPANLISKDWRTNALGRNVSHAFGYGLMDAAAMITMARRWTTVPAQYTCEVKTPQMDKFIPAKGYIELKLGANCSSVRFLEHVQSKVTLSASRRGDLHIYLVSPHGTRSTLLAQRPNDQAEQGFKNWPFMTVHSWGEPPNGVWTLEVHNDGKPQNRAYLKEWTLILYGTYDDPNRNLEPTGSALHPKTPESQPHAHSKPASVKLPSAPLPPPVPPQANHPASELDQLPPPQRPLWALPSSPPPPPPPPPLPPILVTVAPPATTTSTYVSKFKTIVTTSSSSPIPPQRPHPASNRVQPSQTSSADFDIVSASKLDDRPTVSYSGETRLKPSARPIGHDEVSLSTLIPQRGSQQDDSLTIRPPSNEIDAGRQEPKMTMKPPVSATELPSSTGTSSNELEANQIDLKLTKDYRSSGDQSSNYQSPTAVTESTFIQAQSETDKSLTAQPKHLDGSTGIRATPTDWTVLLAITMFIFHLINPLVRQPI